MQVLRLTSESGDEYGPWKFRSRMSESEVLEFLIGKLGQEHPDLAREGSCQPPGPGFLGTYLSISWQSF
jgi:hypothetical protein